MSDDATTEVCRDPESVGIRRFQAREQRRKDEVTPYINHPIALANVLGREAGIHDDVVLAAACFTIRWRTRRRRRTSWRGVWRQDRRRRRGSDDDKSCEGRAQAHCR